MRATGFTLSLGIALLSCSGTTIAAPPAPAPTTNPGPNGSQLLGCFQDSRDARYLTNRMQIPSGDSGMTVAQCTTACATAGYGLAGVEYGRECWCANRENWNSPANREPRCNTPCAGDSSEVCGGSDAITVYAVGSVEQGNYHYNHDWSFHGCWTTDSVRNRILRHQATVPGGPKAMTVDACVAACGAKGYSIAGLEYSQECWCDNKYNHGMPGDEFYRDDELACNMPCRGSPAQTCGGRSALSVYTYETDKVTTDVTNDCVENALVTLGKKTYRQVCEGLYEYPELERYWPGSKAQCLQRCDDWDECRAFEFYGDSCTFFERGGIVIWTYGTQVLVVE